jgi:hypothetical protein
MQEKVPKRYELASHHQLFFDQERVDKIETLVWMCHTINVAKIINASERERACITFYLY